MKLLNIFAVGLALVLSVNAQAEIKVKVMRSFEFIDKESYERKSYERKSKESFVSLKVNVLEVEHLHTSCNYKMGQQECVPTVIRKTERISFNSCSYEVGENKGEKKVCTFLGAEDGYEPSVAKEKLYNYEEEERAELVTTALLGAGVIATGVVRWKMVRPQFSGYVILQSMKIAHPLIYGILLAGSVGGKMLFIDDAGNAEEMMYHRYDSLTTGESNFDGNMLIVVEDEDFDAEKMINKLSRALSK